MNFRTHCMLCLVVLCLLIDWAICGTIALRSSDSSVHNDYLVYSTPSSVNVFDLKESYAEPTAILTLTKYLINKFSISYRDNLILYGKNTIHATPIG